MTARQQLAANGGIFCKAATLQLLESDGCFVVIELADEVVAMCNGRPAKKWIGLPLHGTLTFSNTLSLMCRGGRRRTVYCEIGRIRRAGLFFDLQEERIIFAIAFQVHEVIAQAHTAGTHHLECDIHGHILIEEVPPLRQRGCRDTVRSLPARPAPGPGAGA